MIKHTPPASTCWTVAFGVCFTVVVVASALQACDTPVYRYAMYRWEPTPYEVYHFHRGEMDPVFSKVADSLRAASRKGVTPANVAVYPVNLDEDPKLTTVPRDVRRLWEKKKENSDAKAPLTMVVNPMGFEVHAGELQPNAVPSFVKSDTRKQVGDLLKKGNAGVYLLILGKDETLNKAAQQAVDKLVKDVNSGKLQLYAGPEPYDPLNPQFELPRDKDGKETKRRAAPEGNKKANSGEASKVPEAEDSSAEADKTAKESAPHSITSLAFQRDKLKSADPWLYRSLMAVENDLYEFQDEPMLFVIYGRGRALPPYIGKGIVYDNLVEITDFITSACSCTVKDQNPGVDLVMAYDWEAASAAVAERFGAEEGNEESLTDLFPQLIIPGGFGEEESATDESESGDDSQGEGIPDRQEGKSTSPDDPDVSDAVEPSTSKAQDETSSVADDALPPAEQAIENEDTSSADAGSRSEGEGGDKAAEIGQQDEFLANGRDDKQLAHADDPPLRAASARSEPSQAAASSSPNLIVPLGIGMGVAFLALLGVTFFVLKPLR